ncbi:hypothetical protein PACTADRAFT_185777 [Pachysolen tannophilus NRRL Y-2460]|uniref:Palmitoyltransferase n=1 Tax=Pachysolen tannophilus NRRL Y-2460 TaxID=669874 RepID=A0A1E4U1L4_PACTA|nr:hypothetical protein PACTADRAFT_185777 [Pachysolen tannophilus NRRL Y-2460]
MIYKIISWFVFNPQSNTDLKTINRDRDLRNYQVFSNSRYLFFFGGRLRTLTNTKRFSIFTFIIILLPLILYLIFESSWLWHHVSPALVILFIYTWFLCFMNFLMAAATDPGILPKNIHITDDSRQLPIEYFNIISLPGYLKNNSVEIKYCNTCHIWRLPRTSHCATCNSCIMFHDHHCMWLDNCVGQRNYRYFLNFLIFACISVIYLIITSFYHLFKYDQFLPIREVMKHIPMTLFLAIYSCLAIMYPALLLTCQLFLTMNLMTTREYFHILNSSPNELKGNNFISKVWNTNSFNSKNIFTNLVIQFCRPRGLSLVRLQDRYINGDSRFENLNNDKDSDFGKYQI